MTMGEHARVALLDVELDAYMRPNGGGGRPALATRREGETVELNPTGSMQQGASGPGAVAASAGPRAREPGNRALSLGAGGVTRTRGAGALHRAKRNERFAYAQIRRLALGGGTLP
jgi:hypothetical protein